MELQWNNDNKKQNESLLSYIERIDKYKNGKNRVSKDAIYIFITFSVL